MRFESSLVVVLAASITISGCSPFQGERQTVDGSFREAPTSELMAMADRYEQRGDYAHAARLYEELLKGDPNRTQARERLHALAAYGVVSPHAQEALRENVETIVAEHQRQRSELAEQDELERHLASMTPISTSEGYQLIDQTSAARMQTMQTPPAWAQNVPVDQPEVIPSESQVASIPSSPTPSFEVPEGPAAWHQTVIRPQQDTGSHTDERVSSRAPMTRLDSTGSNLWRTATLSSTNESTADVEPESVADGDEQTPEWANPENHSAESTAATIARSDDWAPRTFVSLEPANEADPFCDPFIGCECEGNAAETEAADAEVSPLQQAQDAFTLWQVSGEATEAVAAMTGLLQNEDPQVVEVTCYLLGEVGPAASLAAASLKTLQESAASEATSIIAAEALVKIDPASNEAVDRLVQASRSTDQKSRVLAAMTLASVDESHSQAVIPALGRMLDDESIEVRSAAALSLGGWGDAASPLESKLEELALADVPEVSEAARIALQCLEQ